MTERSFQGSSGVAGAAVAAIVAAIAVVVGGLWVLQALRLGPVFVIAVLVAAVLVCVAVLKAIGTDATWSIEPDALVCAKRRSVRRIAYATFEQVSYFGYDQIWRTPHVVIALRNGAQVIVWAKAAEQGPELEAFCAILRERAGR